MQKNLYFRTMFRRHNQIKEYIYALFYAICSIPRLLLETFLRRNMGERYFSFSTAIFTALFLLPVPFVLNAGRSMINPYGGTEFSVWSFLLHYLTWYGFLGGFVYMAIQRRKEIKRLPSAFNFGRFSLSAGVVDQRFYQVKFGNRSVDIRQIETIVEPGFCFAVGLALQILAQPVGLLIMICAICYAMSYFATYSKGDNFILDRIDEQIMNEEHVNAFIDMLPSEDTRGVRYYGRTPADPEFRRQLTDSVIVEVGEVIEAR